VAAITEENFEENQHISMSEQFARYKE